MQKKTPGGEISGFDPLSTGGNIDPISDSNIFGLGSLPGVILEDPHLPEQPLPMDEGRLRLAASVFAHAHDGILITDASWRIVDVNRAYCRLTGFSSVELISQPCPQMQPGALPTELHQRIQAGLNANGFWRGEIGNRHKNGDMSTESVSINAVYDLFDTLTNYVVMFSDMSALRESQKRLEHLAYHDALTGLPNRALLADRIEQALAQASRRKSLTAVCYLDLDHFKPINDAFGHDTGDQMLVEVARRIRHILHEGDTVARLGGDEFALVLTDFESPDYASEMLSDLLQSLSLPHHDGPDAPVITASIGYTLIPGDEGDADSLLRHADQAMFLAKQRGGNCLELFDIRQERQVRDHHEALGRIRKALDDREFRLYYQPKYDMHRSRIAGFEALIRWQHPQRGLLAPADFLPLIGDHPLLTEIGDWVVRETLQQISAWSNRGLKFPVSVNMSGRDVMQTDFVDRLKSHFAEFPGVSPRSLELELLETAALEDIDEVSRRISACREFGVDFALDDFGTGYSSLLYLKRLPVKTLKIDQSFVRDMLETVEATEALAGILGLSSAFKRKVIAEGMEFVEQGIVLLRLKCDVAQGFAIARPMPAEEVPGWVASYRPDPAWQDSLDQPWRRSDFPLLAAEVEHRRWLSAIEAAVRRNDGRYPLARFRNLRNTAFGHWLLGMGTSRYGHLPEMRALPGLHDRLLRLCSEISAHIQQLEKEKALAMLPVLAEWSREYHQGLLALRRAIVNHAKSPNPR